MNRLSPCVRLFLAAALLATGGLGLGSSGCSNESTGGTPGSAGTSGGAGTTGAAGTGTAGTTGAAGTGSAGTTGAAGTGSAGTGTAGTTGAAGTGSAGTTGAAGTNADGGAADKPSGDGGMTLTTTSLKTVDGGLVFPPASSAPMNQSPALMWSGAPAGTLSFALSMKDLTANNTHFVLYDIDPGTMALPANLPRGAMPAMPAGAVWKSAFGGTPGYQGPGGPNVNNYEVQIWALKVAKLQVGNMELNAIYTTLLPSQKLDSAKFLAKGTRDGL